MPGHPNVRLTQIVRLTPICRKRLIRRHLDQDAPLRRIAKALQAPLSTVGHVMNALGLGRL